MDIKAKQLRAKLSQIEAIGRENKAVLAGQQITREILEDTSRELNLIGRKVGEAIQLAEKFLDRAFVSGVVEVRLVHGFGSGRLQEALQSFLSEHPQVSQVQRAEGAIIVALHY